MQAPNPNAAAIVSPFPAPPEYAKQYTSDRVASVCFSFLTMSCLLNSSYYALLLQMSVPHPPPVQNVFVAFGEEYKLDDEIIRFAACFRGFLFLFS